MLAKPPKPISKKSLITARDIDTILTWATIVSKEKVWTKSNAKLALKLKMEQRRLRHIIYVKNKITNLDIECTKLFFNGFKTHYIDEYEKN